MIYVFDTNIILHYLKEDAVMHKIKADFNPLIFKMKHGFA